MAAVARYLRPPAPSPRSKPLGTISLLRALKKNPIECWTEDHFEKFIIPGGLAVGHVVLVNAPSAIRRVLLDNAANYRKDAILRRVLSAGMNDGLLTAEGDQWRAQRRAVAPMFARKTVME